MILLVGHLHDGGNDIQLTINGKEICDSKAIYGGKGFEGKSADGKAWNTINHMDLCPTTIPLKRGDELVIQANYDTEKHPG
jgi:hypothetical protein